MYSTIVQNISVANGCVANGSVANALIFFKSDQGTRFEDIFCKNQKIFLSQKIYFPPQKKGHPTSTRYSNSQNLLLATHWHYIAENECNTNSKNHIFSPKEQQMQLMKGGLAAPVVEALQNCNRFFVFKYMEKNLFDFKLMFRINLC